MLNLDKFFNPKSVAVIGASEDPKKVGFALVKNLNQNRNLKVFPVNLQNKEIPEADLAVIAVKAESVPAVLEECGNKNIKNAIIISSGFKESGEEGKKLEEEIRRIAEEKEISVLGPNCLGVIDTKNDLNASFSSQKPLPGKIAFLSQSGALGTAMLDWALGEGVGFSKFISLGNEVSLTEVEFLEYLKEDKDTDAILVYLEKVSDGEKFMRLLSQITQKKPLVILKAGISSRGLEAVASHTGSLAPESAVFSGACRQAGAVTVSSLREFFNVAKLLHLGVQVNEPVKNLAIVTNGGGPSVVAADLVEASRSLYLVRFNEKTAGKLREVLPQMAAVGNPVDIIGDALPDRYEKTLEILRGMEKLHGIIVMLTPQMMTDAPGVAKVISKYSSPTSPKASRDSFSAKKKIFPVFMGGPSVEEGKAVLIKSGLVNFEFPEDIVEALDALAEGKFEKKTDAGLNLNRALRQISFADTLKILSDYGISVSGSFINRKEDLENTLRECGWSPYVMKAISGSAVHKTEAGTVKLNVSSFDEAGRVWEELWTNPKVMGRVEGILIQKMEKGMEVIIGMKRDKTFGPAILFGLGGIFTEAIKDTSVRVAPVGKEEAMKMMLEIKGTKILEGLRGEPPVNFDALAEIITKISKLSLEHPEIKEIDLNPVICSGNSVTVVDARVMI